MDFTAPLPERLFFGVVRAAVLGVRSLKALDWVLMAIIVALVVPIPVYRRGAALGFEGLAVLLAVFFSLVNTYVLLASWIPDIVSPEPSTIAAVDITNFLSPIAADATLLYNTALDSLAQGASFQQFVLATAPTFSLKIARLVDALPFVQNKLRLIVQRIAGEVALQRFEVVWGRPRMPHIRVPPKLSVEIGTALQLVDNLYSFSLFLKSVYDERQAAWAEGPAYIPRAALASQPPRALILLAFTNFVAPIILGSAQLSALLNARDEDARLPFYLSAIKALIQVLGGLGAALLAKWARRRIARVQLDAGAVRLEGEEGVLGPAQFVVAPGAATDVSSPQTHIDVRHLAQVGREAARGQQQSAQAPSASASQPMSPTDPFAHLREIHSRSHSRIHSPVNSTIPLPVHSPAHSPARSRHHKRRHASEAAYPAYRWMSYARAFQQHPEDSQHWDYFLP